MRRLEHMLRALIDAVVDECERNPEFAGRVAEALGAEPRDGPPRYSRTRGNPARDKRTGRRPPGPFDPFEVYASGEEVLRGKLQQLNEEQLKDIIAEHSMDTSRRAMKWQDHDRLVAHIVTIVSQRSRKGEAFMTRESKSADAGGQERDASRHPGVEREVREVAGDHAGDEPARHG